MRQGSHSEPRRNLDAPRRKCVKVCVSPLGGTTPTQRTVLSSETVTQRTSARRSLSPKCSHVELLEAQANQVFLATLDSLTEQRRATSASKQATNYAPRLMTDSGLVVGFNKNDLERAMQRLFKIGVIIADAELWRRKNRHCQTGIGRKN